MVSGGESVFALPLPVTFNQGFFVGLDAYVEVVLYR